MANNKNAAAQRKQASSKSASSAKRSSSASKGGRQQSSSASKGKAPQKRSLTQEKPQSKQQQLPMKQSMLSKRIRNDLIGVLIIAVAVVLLIAVSLPSKAIITSGVSMVMHSGFGVGAYLLPVFMMVFGVCFFFLRTHELVLPRIALGLVLIFLAIIALSGVNAPSAATNPGYLFDEAYVTTYGGYIGNGIAYAMLTLMGQVISWVILAAVIVGSLVLIGFSISGFFDWLRDKRTPKQKPQFTAPYSRARELDQNMLGQVPAGEQGGFVPAGSSDRRASGSYANKKNGKRNPSDDVTQMLDGSSRAGRAATTQVLDPDDELMQGRPKRSGAAGKTRKLVGDDQEDAAAAPTVMLDQDGQQSAKPSKKKAAKTQLLADSQPVPTEEGVFMLPDPRILKRSSLKPQASSSSYDLAEMGARLQDTLHEFNVDADVVGWVHGPTVTLFKVALASGVRVNKVTALSDDIALAFASQSVRIFSPIAGTSLVGIEIPNDMRENVLLGDVLPAAGSKPLLMAIGKDVEGNSITADLAKMPHLLIGGTTGSGKSVAINSMIMSVLMRATPDDVRMILIDPKRVELSLYNDIPHLYVPVVTDPHKAASTLAWAVTEMERRLKLFEEVGARNITQYARLRQDFLARRDQALAERAAREAQGIPEPEGVDDEWLTDEWEHMPSIMIVIDELADLMMVAGKEVETSISRIAQLARAAGIHMIVATQRPSTNVITGLIKANITNRIAFNVASGIDSRVILDSTGAERLIGLGDMLLSKPELGKPLRVQGCFVGEDEINEVCKFLRGQGKPDYHEDIFTTAVPVLDTSGSSSMSSGGAGSDEDLLWEAAEIVVTSNLGSTSALQRRLKVGYARAGRIMDMLEDKGIVGPANGSKPREVYVEPADLPGLRAMDEAGQL